MYKLRKMKGNIQLEIEHVKYKDFVDFDNLQIKRMVLAPIKEDQDKAILRFFYEKGESIRKLVHEEIITLVPFKKNTEILLNGTPKNKHRVDCSVQVDQGPVQNFILRKPVNLAALFLSLAGAAALALLIIFLGPVIANAISEAGKNKPLVTESGPADKPADTGSTSSGSAQGTSSAQAEVMPADTSAAAVAAAKQTESVTIYFRGDTADLKDGEDSKLDALANKLRGKEILKFRIDGHTADFFTEAGQKYVSKLRVDAVFNYLKSKLGSSLPEPEKNYYGSTQSVSSGTGTYYLDRRAEISVEYQ